MQIQPQTQYYYTRNLERQGPVTGAALIDLVRQGGLAATDLVWSAGMAEWAPASTFAGLMPGSYAAPPPPPPSPSWPGTTGGYGVASASATPSRALFPRAPLGKARFGLWLGLTLGSIVIFVIGGILLGSASYYDDEQKIAGGVVLAFGFAMLVTAYVFGAINIFRAWAAIQGLPGVASTPGKAIGFCFIPFFNLYWIFIAFSQWAKDYNKFIRHGNISGAQPVGEGLFLTFCILAVCGVIPYIGTLFSLPNLVIGPICVAQMCGAANYLKAQSDAAI